MTSHPQRKSEARCENDNYRRGSWACTQVWSIGIGAEVRALTRLALASMWSHTLDAILYSKVSLFMLGNFLYLPGESWKWHHHFFAPVVRKWWYCEGHWTNNTAKSTFKNPVWSWKRSRNQPYKIIIEHVMPTIATYIQRPYVNNWYVIIDVCW